MLVIACEFITVPSVELWAWRTSAAASTVIWSDCAPTSKTRSKAGVSMTLSRKEPTSAVLKPLA
jgi:hypothetical protein